MVLGGIGDLVGGIGVLAGWAGSGGKGSLIKAKEAWEKLAESDFDMSKLSPPELRVVAEYFPRAYDAVTPEISLGEDSPEVRDQQLQALLASRRVMEEGLPLAERVAAQDAQRAVMDAHRRAQASVFRDMAERGRLGAGAEAAGRLQAGQSGAELARGLGSDLARYAVENRLRGIAQTGQLAGQLRGQDYGISADRANAMNAFNLAVTGRQTDAARYAADAQNAANLYNVGQRQQVADANELARYANEVRGQEYPNALKGQLFNQQLAKTQGLAGAYGNIAQARYAEQAAKADAIRGIGSGVGQIGGLGLGLGGVGPFGAGGALPFGQRR